MSSAETSAKVGDIGSGLDIVRFNAAQHAVLAGVGAGSDLGEALRQYWIPALLSEEVAGADAPPTRLRLLGQDLVAFRDSAGQIGVLDEHCVHRGASLFFGRVADGGIQCVYHGWKFDVSGRNVAAPTCPRLTGDPRLAQPAYAVHEAGGLIFVHLGHGEPPPLPGLGWLLVGDEARAVGKRRHPAHWLQALEADTDSAHVAYLHRENLLANASDPLVAVMLSETAPELEADDTEYGLLLAAHRPSGPDRLYTRVNHWLTPWYTVVPAEHPEGLISIHAWVPVDDENCLIFSLMWHPGAELTSAQRERMRAGQTGIFPEMLDDGSYRARRHSGNEFEIDRAAQALGSPWSGVTGNQEQDDAITASMGPAYDRTRENLVGADAAVIAVRLALLDMAEGHLDGRPLRGLRGRGFDVPSAFFERDAAIDFRVLLAAEMAPKQVALAVAR